MSKYLTKQRKMLTDYLSERPHEQYTARQIADGIGDKISISSVYRNLAEMEKDNSVKRFIKDNSKEAYYQYVDVPKCRDCLHLSCRICGKSLHMKDDEAEELVSDILKNTGFKLDKSETVLYGICKACSK